MPGKRLAEPGVAASVLCLLFVAAAGLHFRIAVDGYRSHAVGTQIRIARYEWYAGNRTGAVETLIRAGATVPEAGLRWQLAQVYFYLARVHQSMGSPARAGQFCHKGLEALDYGQFDHTRNGTSTTFYRCERLQPAGLRPFLQPGYDQAGKPATGVGMT